MTSSMDGETKTVSLTEKSDTGSSKKTKILTLLLPSDTKEQKKDKNKPPTKVVVRRLPPKLTKELLLKELSPLPEHDYVQFTRGDLSLGSNAFSRAYINFTKQEDIFVFKEKFDDYVFKDEKGKEYHAVVEFAPFQKIPRRINQKKKAPKLGTLEADPKYLEYLQKLEDAKNMSANSASEYFHETDASSAKPKVTTTPLLEYLKQKKQKRLDTKNEIRPRKRETEWEKRRNREEERRKSDRDRRIKDDKIDRRNRYDDKSKDDKNRKSEDRTKERSSLNRNKKSDERLKKGSKTDSKEGEVVESEKEPGVVPNDPAILKIVIRQSGKTSENDGSPTKSENKETQKTIESDNTVESGNDTTLSSRGKKYSEFRSRIADEKQKKNYIKSEGDDVKTSDSARRNIPDEKGDSYNIGKEASKKYEKPTDASKKVTRDQRSDTKTIITETKSRYRYSEQRNRDREYRNSKANDSKEIKNISQTERSSETNEGISQPVDDAQKISESNVSKSAKDEQNSSKVVSNLSQTIENDTTIGFIKLTNKFSSPTKKLEDDSKYDNTRRRKSLEYERETNDNERRRSKSLHDVAEKQDTDDNTNDSEKRLINNSQSNSDDNSSQNEKDIPDRDMRRAMSNDSNDDESSQKRESAGHSDKDPRIERRIRNKDRPSIEIYRPGMGKFSKQRLDQKKEDFIPPCPTSSNKTSKASSSKPVKKTVIKSSEASDKPLVKNDDSNVSSSSLNKSASEVRSMTFKRTVGKEN